LKHDVTNEELQERAALYALGALSQNEARAFESHLSEPCGVCLQELSAYEGVTAHLSFAPQEIAPPDYLRDVLMRRVEREPASLAPVLHFPDPGARSEGDMRISGQLSKPNYLPWALAASLAIVAIASVIFSKQANDQSARLQQEIAAARREAQELEQIKSTISSPDLRLIQLGGQDASSQSAGKIYWDLQKNKWVVTVILPPAPEGKVYQLWFITPDEKKVSAGLIKTKEDGQGSTIVDVPPSVRSVAAAAITLEPEGGSAQPTSEIYALGKT
jgi:anti-sigma-K factor RskA